jgi:predicted dehydrogenase
MCDRVEGSSRRAFASAAALAVPATVLGGAGRKAPGDSLRIAAVGVGGMGRRYIQGCASERIVALCDVDHDLAAKVFNKYAQAAVFRDWRRMMDREKEFDAVIVATPDHHHAAVTLAALKLGKAVYCAKPLTHTLHELRLVREAARKAGTATQTSVQSAAGDAACTTAEYLMSGVIGHITEIHVWCDHPLYPAGQVRPSQTPQTPSSMDWDLWLGPAPYRPYSRAYHPWIWRSWWDFGTGTVGDMLSHALHVFYRPLRLGAPVAVHGCRSKMHGGLFEMDGQGNETLPPLIPTPESESHASALAFDFPARGEMPPLRMHWYDGGLKPFRPAELPKGTPLPASGVLYCGEKGKMLTAYSGGRNLLLPEKRFRDFAPPPKTLERTTGHYEEWVRAAKGQGRTNCGFELGAQLAEVALLGTLAARSARYLEWDSVRGVVVNDEEANSWVNPPRRNGWEL